MSIIRTLALLVVFSSSIPLAVGDTLLIDSVQSGQSMAKPRAGTSMALVRSRLGDPVSQMPAIGWPPISRWTYNDFVVYFEHEHVVHTVVSHQK